MAISPVVPTPGPGGSADLPRASDWTPAPKPDWIGSDGKQYFAGGWWIVWPDDPIPKPTRNKGKAASTSQKQIGGPGTFIPPRYGLVRVGAIISSVVVYQGNLYLLCVWGEGEIDAIEQLYVNDEAAPSGVTATHYLGTATQTVDPWLVAAWAAQGKTYTDTLPNIAYSVVKVPPKKNTGFPEVSARLRGIKVPLTDGGTPTYSRVPAYIIANHIENTRYGMKAQVDWTSVAACATYNNETLGGDVRHRMDISCDQLASAEQWLLTLCDNASIIPTKIGDTWFLTPDKPASVEVTLTADDLVEGSLRWKKRGPRASPNAIEVSYTNTTTDPWKEESVFVYGIGVEEGTVDRALQRVNKPGITRYAEAYRYGLQLLNDYITSDLTISFMADDRALAWTPGTVIDLTAGPFASKKLRLTSIQASGPKLYQVSAKEYDAAKWSDAVQSGPTTLDTALPSPLSPTTPTGLSVAEDIFQLQTGRYASRLKIAWTGPTRTDYVYLKDFAVVLTDGTNESTFLVPFDTFEYTTAALPENTAYTVDLYARSDVAESAPVSTAITTLGKQAIPGDVQALTAYSTNGETRIFWTLGIDLDLASTELRYSDQVVAAWDDATFLAYVPVPSRSLVTTLVPSGSRRIWAKMRDATATEAAPYGQESATALSYDLEVVPSNTSSTDEYVLTDDALANMIADGVGGWITSFAADSWDGTFTAAMSTYTNPVASYHTSGTSSLVTDSIDTGESSAAQVTLDGYSYDNLSGTARVYIEYKALVGDSWTSIDGTAVSVIGRYFRVGFEWTTTESGHIHSLGVLRKVVDATGSFVRDTVLNDEIAWVM